MAKRVELATRAVVPWCKPFFVFTSRISFSTCRKDALPAENLSHVIYLFNCECSRSYVGRTTQRLGERIQQHIPRDLVTAVTGGVRERRKPGRPRKDGASRVQSMALENEPVSSRTRSKASISTVSAPSSAPAPMPISQSDTAITRHLRDSTPCLKAVAEKAGAFFSILARGRNRSHLCVLEAVTIHCRKPDLCVQKEHVKSLALFK